MTETLRAGARVFHAIPCQSMSQNRHPSFNPTPVLGGGAVVVGRFEMSIGERFDWHRHPVHQLAWTEQGVLAVSVADKTWILPPTRALWIPSSVVHSVKASRPSTMRGIYFRKRRCPIRWDEPTIVPVTPLIRELVMHLGGARLERDARRHAQHVLLGLLTPLSATTIDVPTPSDPRARRVADALVRNPADDRTLSAFGRSAGASARTLARLFAGETGVPFGAWRTRLRLRASLVHLAEGVPVSIAGDRVGYRSASAFVSAFRRHVGLTPGAYFARDAD